MIAPAEGKRLLITGGTGYIGSKVILRLIESEAEVSALTRSRPVNTASGVRWLNHDGSIESVSEALRGARPDQVIHLAARHVRQHDRSDVAPLVEANITYGAVLLEAMREQGCHRLIYAASAFQHSATAEGGPRNLYAATKNAFEEILDYYESSAGIETVRLTLCDVYGEDDQRRRLLNAAVKAALHGTALQAPTHDPYLLPVHIQDVVEAFRMALTIESVGQRFWVGPDAGVRLNGIVALVARLAGSALQVERVDLPALPGDTLAPVSQTTIPGWLQSISLEEGVRRMIESYRASG